MPMPKSMMPGDAAKALSARERVLLFCVGSGTDLRHAGLSSDTVSAVIVKQLISRDGAGMLGLTERGRAVLRAMLADL
jgi:hypothetical protein